jgi:hypothetical protein
MAGRVLECTYEGGVLHHDDNVVYLCQHYTRTHRLYVLFATVVCMMAVSGVYWAWAGVVMADSTPPPVYTFKLDMETVKLDSTVRPYYVHKVECDRHVLVTSHARRRCTGDAVSSANMRSSPADGYLLSSNLCSTMYRR